MENSALAHAVKVILQLDQAGTRCLDRAEWAKRAGLSEELLAMVVDCLERQGIVAADAEAPLGCKLTRPLDQITLLHVVEATEGRIHYTPAPSTLSSDLVETLRGAIAEINTGVRTKLAAITLADLAS